MISFINGKDSFNAEKVTAAANHVARYPLCENCTDRVDENGFSRAGFSGQDIQPGAELHRNLFEQGKIPYAEAMQHCVPLPSTQQCLDACGHRFCCRFRLDQQEDAVISRNRAEDFRPS